MQQSFDFMEAPPMCAAIRKCSETGALEIKQKKSLNNGWAFLCIDPCGAHCIVEVYADQTIKTIADPSQIAAMWQNI